MDRHIVEFQSTLDCQSCGRKGVRPIDVVVLFSKTLATRGTRQKASDKCVRRARKHNSQPREALAVQEEMLAKLRSVVRMTTMQRQERVEKTHSHPTSVDASRPRETAHAAPSASGGESVVTCRYCQWHDNRKELCPKKAADLSGGCLTERERSDRSCAIWHQGDITLRTTALQPWTGVRKRALRRRLPRRKHRARQTEPPVVHRGWGRLLSPAASERDMQPFRVG